MITPVNNTPKTQNLPKFQSAQGAQNPSRTVKTSIFYVNDIHGQVAKMERIKTASNAFDSLTPSDTAKLKLSGGDTLLGEDLNLNKSVVEFLKSIKLDASAVGNHELDISPQDFVNFTKDAQCKLLGLNAKISKENVLNERIINSYVQERNGEQFGIIGLMPFDLFTRLKYKTRFAGLEIKSPEQTAIELQKEINDLQAKGINKIILLSHAGNEVDKLIAKNITGIDVIIGGHSHELVKDLKQGENLFYTKNGEPIVITQAGKDGQHFGVLNLEFNEKGIITKAQNNVQETKDFSENKPLKYVFDKIMGKSIKAGNIAHVEDYHENSLITENPHASLMADAMRVGMKTDIALVNSANLRGHFLPGSISDRDISEITPFKNKMTIIELNEKELVEALDFGAKSIISENHKPGVLQVSGLKYTMNKAGNLVEARFIDKNNQEIPIDVKNPNTFKTYSVAIDDYYAKGKDNFTMLNKLSTAKIFDFDKDKLTFDYIQKSTTPLEIKKDGRITIVE